MTPATETLERDILWTRLTAMVSEQAVRLQRAAFSHMVREAGDLSVGVFDTGGRLVVQAVTGTPGHIFALPSSVKTLLSRFPWSELRDGDVLITNDPYIGCGHQYDVTVMTPVFGPSGPLAICASTCHVVDVGGRRPSADGADVFEEGVILPPLKLVEAGEPSAAVDAFIRANVRLPDEVVGDINALVGANRVGGLRLVEYLEELGTDNFDAIADDLIGRTEAAMRAAVQELPDGTYRARTESDGTGPDDPIHIEVRIDVSGDRIAVDYDGSSPASEKGINVVLNYTRAYTAYALKCVLAPDTPSNEGALAPIEVRAPEGSLLNARRPAPVSMRHVIGHLIPGAIFTALAKAVPERVIAEGSGAVWMTSILTSSEDSPSIASFASAGGMGARPNKDGLACTSFPTGTSSVPVETLESGGEVVVHSREITPDSGGCGRFRGGCGQSIRFELRDSGGGSIISSTDRLRIPAVGADGGEAGGAGAFEIAGRAADPKGNNAIAPGAQVLLRLPGGGGHGDPLQRDPEAVRADVVAGYVSPASARDHYGVVLEGPGLAVELEATRQLRAERRR